MHRIDANDVSAPLVWVQVRQIRKVSAMMDLSLRVVENDEYAGCIILPDQKIIIFKVDYMGDLVKAMETIP